ncbi:MAG: flagellin [Clostridiales bacterium]|nr:flagellin [Clostridiales bacterium]
MRINYNAQAMRANTSLAKADNLLTQSLQRLSSGLKVSSAKQNPSGYAMSKRMNMQIEGLSTATQSANDGISIIETVDGALSEVHEMLQRLNELCVKAANGTMTDDDRSIIQSEVDQLKEEITRVSKTTEFNGQVLLDGTFDLKGYTNDNDVKVQYYSDQVQAQKYMLNSLNVSFNAEGDITAVSPATITGGTGFPANASVSYENNRVIISGEDDFEMILSITPPEITPPATEGTKPFSKLTIDCTGTGALDMQIGANEGQSLAIRIPAVSLENMSIDKIHVRTADAAEASISKVESAIKFVSSVRSRLGAYQNRLEHTVNSLSVTSENMTKAYSGIVDVDMATEMTEYTSKQVISQAATSMLAQANERPSNVLQLLQ